MISYQFRLLKSDCDLSLLCQKVNAKNLYSSILKMELFQLNSFVARSIDLTTHISEIV